MGKKRKIIAKPQKFGRKFALHPVSQVAPVADLKEEEQKVELEKQKVEEEMVKRASSFKRKRGCRKSSFRRKKRKRN